MLEFKSISRCVFFVLGIVVFLYVFCTLLCRSVFACMERVHGGWATLGVFCGAFIYIAGFILCTWSFVRGCVVDAGPVRPWLRREIVEGHVIGILNRWARKLPPSQQHHQVASEEEEAATTTTATKEVTTTTTTANAAAVAAALTPAETKIKFVSRAAQLRQVLSEESSEAKIKANDAMTESMHAREAQDALEVAELKAEQEELGEEEDEEDQEPEGEGEAALDANGQPVKKKQKIYIKGLLKRKKKKQPPQQGSKEEGRENGDEEEEEGEDEDEEKDKPWQPAYINEADNPVRMAERRERKLQRGMAIRSVAQVAKDALDTIVRYDATHTTTTTTPSASSPTTIVNINTNTNTTAETDAKLEQMKLLLHGVAFCAPCQVYQFANTHHCKYCDQCVFQQSHHCFAMGQCAGYDNIKYVLLCEIYASLWCGAGAILTTVSLTNNWSHIVVPYTNEFHTGYYYAFTLGTTFAVVFTALAINNLIAISKGQSFRREMRRKERMQRAETERAMLEGNAYVPLDTREEDADDFFSYREAEASLDNFKNAVGEDSNVAWWLLPVPPRRRPQELDRKQFMEELDKVVDVQLHAVADVEDAEEQLLDNNINNNNNNYNHASEHDFQPRRPSALENDDDIIIPVPPPPMQEMEGEEGEGGALASPPVAAADHHKY